MTDYATLIDAETRDFIRRTDTFYPPDTVDWSVADQRDVFNTMCRAFHQGYPPGITATDAPMGGVPCRVYETTGVMPATVVYLHGGGFVVGGLDSHDDVCAEIAATTGFRVVSADYRLAPEHRHPAHFNDALAAVLAAAAAYPGPFLLCGDTTCAPLQDRRFDGLPPTVIITAQCDPLASDGPAYAEAITAAGGHAECHEEAGLVHGYLRARSTVTRARNSFARICGALSALGAGRWPAL